MKTICKALIFIILFLSIPLTGHPSQKDDVSMMVSATTIMQKIKQKERLFLVDTRSEKAFNTFKIPGSINIPLSFIKTKPFLKTKLVVMINKGFACKDMMARAKYLNKNGFDIKILKGGLLAWKHKNGPLVGDPFAPQNLNKISATTFFSEKDSKEINIINAGKKLSTKNLIKAVHLPKVNEKTIKKTLSFLKNNPMHCAVVFNETGKGYQNIEKIIPKTFYHQVFYLEGGMHAYQTFLKHQMLANKPKSQRIKETGHCEPCKKQDNE